MRLFCSKWLLVIRCWLLEEWLLVIGTLRFWLLVKSEFSLKTLLTNNQKPKGVLAAPLTINQSPLTINQLQFVTPERCVFREISANRTSYGQNCVRPEEYNSMHRINYQPMFFGFLPALTNNRKIFSQKKIVPTTNNY